MDNSYSLFLQGLQNQPSQPQAQATPPNWIDSYKQDGRSKWLDAYGQNDLQGWGEYYDRYRELFGGNQPEGFSGGGYGDQFQEGIDQNNPKYQFYNNQLTREADARRNEWQEWMDNYSKQQAARDQQLMDFLRSQQQAAAQPVSSGSSGSSRSSSSGSSSSSAPTPEPEASPKPLNTDGALQIMARNRAAKDWVDAYGGGHISEMGFRDRYKIPAETSVMFIGNR